MNEQTFTAPAATFSKQNNRIVVDSTSDNLSPFFSVSFDDYYNAETRPNGYWAVLPSESTATVTQLDDGWVKIDAPAKSNSYSVSFGVMRGQLTPVDGTILLEVRNCTTTTTPKFECFGINTSALESRQSVFTSGQAYKKYYVSVTAKRPTASRLCELRFSIPTANKYLKAEFRVSYYAGSYSGDYQPMGLSIECDRAEWYHGPNGLEVTTSDFPAKNLIPGFTVPYVQGSNWRTAVYTDTGRKSYISVPASGADDGFADVVYNTTGATASIAFQAAPAAQDLEADEYTLLVETELVSGSPLVGSTSPASFMIRNNLDYDQLAPDMTMSVSLDSILGAVGERKLNYFKLKKQTPRSTPRLFQIESNKSNDAVACRFKMRISLYEGDYNGPYVPYEA